MDQDGNRNLPTQSRPSSGLSRKGREIDADHARWIRARVATLLSFYWTPGDEAIAKGQSHQFVRILADYSRAEIDAAATRYEAEEPTRPPNPARIVALIEDRRKAAMIGDLEQRRRLAEQREHEEWTRRREQRPSPEEAEAIVRAAGFPIIKKFGGNGHASTSEDS